VRARGAAEVSGHSDTHLRRLQVAPLDVVLFQQAIEAAAADTQRAGGAGFVTRFALQHLDDVLLFNRGKIVMMGFGRGAGLE
jgi:hypothetical protein